MWGGSGLNPSGHPRRFLFVKFAAYHDPLLYCVMLVQLVENGVEVEGVFYDLRGQASRVIGMRNAVLFMFCAKSLRELNKRTREIKIAPPIFKRYL